MRFAPIAVLAVAGFFAVYGPAEPALAQANNPANFLQATLGNIETNQRAADIAAERADDRSIRQLADKMKDRWRDLENQLRDIAANAKVDDRDLRVDLDRNQRDLVADLDDARGRDVDRRFLDAQDRLIRNMLEDFNRVQRDGNEVLRANAPSVIAKLNEWRDDILREQRNR